MGFPRGMGPINSARHSLNFLFSSILRNKVSQLPTPNSQLPTPNSQLPTPNSQLPTPNIWCPGFGDLGIRDSGITRSVGRHGARDLDITGVRVLSKEELSRHSEELNFAQKLGEEGSFFEEMPSEQAI